MANRRRYCVSTAETRGNDARSDVQACRGNKTEARAAAPSRGTRAGGCTSTATCADGCRSACSTRRDERRRYANANVDIELRFALGRLAVSSHRA